MPGRPPKRLRYAFANDALRQARSAQPVYAWRKTWTAPKSLSDNDSLTTYKVFKWEKTGQTVVHEDDEEDNVQQTPVAITEESAGAAENGDQQVSSSTGDMDAVDAAAAAVEDVAAAVYSATSVEHNINSAEVEANSEEKQNTTKEKDVADTQEQQISQEEVVSTANNSVESISASKSLLDTKDIQEPLESVDTSLDTIKTQADPVVVVSEEMDVGGTLNDMDVDADKQEEAKLPLEGPGTLPPVQSEPVTEATTTTAAAGADADALTFAAEESQPLVTDEAPATVIHEIGEPVATEAPSIKEPSKDPETPNAQ
ncbi:hypothetical protein GGI07_000567 [Coemansia sp. Benny D115]|nr:hypothetical protein GGI07_000567 [Coemansia sp. Benny D115]